MENRAMTIQEVAAYLNISRQMVYNLINEKKLKVFKVGRASRIMFSDLSDFIENEKKNFIESKIPVLIEDSEELEIKNLKFSGNYFESDLFNFNVGADEILGIIGGSDSGKSLLLRTIAGIHHQFSGKIILNGRDISELPPGERGISFVFQEHLLLPNKNSTINMGLPLYFSGEKIEDIRESIFKLVENIDGVSDLLDRDIKKLPDCARQIIAVLREDFNPSDLVLMDNPFSDMDPEKRPIIRNHIKNIIHRFSKKGIISFSNYEDAMHIADKIMVIENGKSIQYGKPLDIYNNPVSETVISLTSNFQPIKIKVDIISKKISDTGLNAELPDGKYILCFRSEEVALSSDNSGIPVNINKTRFYDNKKEVAECTVYSEELEILLPEGTRGKVFIKPLKPYFFMAGD